MKSLLCILAFGLTAVLGLTVVPKTTETVPTKLPNGCLYNGVLYKPGEQFSPNPCMFCHCDDSGRHMCAIADCIVPPCVDAVNKPDNCCPVCPNGPNCRAPDGAVIKHGETHTTDKGAVCQCPVHAGHFWGAQSAICALPMAPAPTVHRDDLPVS